MKWTLAQLRKEEFPIIINEEIDFSPYFNRINDLKSMSKVKVSGQGYEMNNDEYVFSLDIEADLVMQCAVTLDDVPYKLSFHVDEVYVKDALEDDLDANIIEGNQINLLEAIVDDVVLNAPIKVVKEGYEDKFPTEMPKEEKINPAFEELKDFFK